MSFDRRTDDMAIPNFPRELGYIHLQKENPIKYSLFNVKTRRYKKACDIKTERTLLLNKKRQL